MLSGHSEINHSRISSSQLQAINAAATTTTTTTTAAAAANTTTTII